MDQQIGRLWYMPEGWGELLPPNTVAGYLKNPSTLQNATSMPNVKKDNWEHIKRYPCIFLSRSPLTFGHSQLLIPSCGDCEEDLFRLASEIICKVVSTFTRAFKNPTFLHKKKIFKPLAENTLTRGDYIKTLVLRTSAQEKIEKEFKVHLVPYFESHAELCKKRFQSLHTVTTHQTGGLLGWLGERENNVDRWEVDPTPTKPMLDQIANEHLKMTVLSQELRMLWPSLNNM